jgi:hypothetical protein
LSEGSWKVLKDTGVKGISYDTRNAKVEAPKGYSKDKLIPRVYVSAMDLGVLSEGKDGYDNIIYAY